MVLYAFLLIFMGYLSFLLYIKIQSPFWFHQPVHHTYMIYPRTFGYWSKPYVIKPIPQIKPNLYSDFFHITTLPYSDMSQEQRSLLLTFLQEHYLDSEDFIYDVKQSTIDAWMTGQKHQSFVSFYREEITKEQREGKQFTLKTSFKKEPVACMIASQQYIWFSQWTHNTESNQSLHFPVYVWDYNCTHRDYKSKNLSRNMIQTHLYNQYKQSPVEACVFKKEVSKCVGIVPLVEYETYTFFIKKTPISKLPIGYKIKRIETRTINAWVELYTDLPQLQSIFDVCLMPPLNNTLECIKNETHYIILLVCTLGGKEVIKGMYVFKDMHTVWDQPDTELQNKRTVQCVSSACFDMSQTLYFFRGFLHSIKELYYQKKGYGVLTMEHNSHNGIILQRWNERYPMHMSTPTTYYLYNLVYPKCPIAKNRFFTFTG
jgi:hypothetical protein